MFPGLSSGNLRWKIALAGGSRGRVHDLGRLKIATSGTSHADRRAPADGARVDDCEPEDDADEEAALGDAEIEMWASGAGLANYLNVPRLIRAYLPKGWIDFDISQAHGVLARALAKALGRKHWDRILPRPDFAQAFKVADRFKDRVGQGIAGVVEFFSYSKPT